MLTANLEPYASETYPAMLVVSDARTTLRSPVKDWRHACEAFDAIRKMLAQEAAANAKNEAGGWRRRLPLAPNPIP